MVVGQSSLPIILGVTAGLAGALAAGGVVANLLFEVRPRDPIVLATVTTVVGGLAVLATLVAARQGMSIEPAAALRED